MLNLCFISLSLEIGLEFMIFCIKLMTSANAVSQAKEVLAVVGFDTYFLFFTSP